MAVVAVVAAGHIASIVEKEREERRGEGECCHLVFVFILVRTPAGGTIPMTFRVDLSTPVSPCYKPPHTYAQGLSPR